MATRKDVWSFSRLFVRYDYGVITGEINCLKQDIDSDIRLDSLFFCVSEYGFTDPFIRILAHFLLDSGD